MNVVEVGRNGPELLAPAGDAECLRAAVENGADAVYFGLQGHNARARAVNFDLDTLPDTMAGLRRRGVRGYVALNTLIFPAEMAGMETLVRRVDEAGVDAVIVQDLGLVGLIREVAPGLPIHASTQMSITSVEGVRLARDLGCDRVILARELSLREVAEITRDAPLPTEVFVHGALCVAYSGQCLTSEALGGRSANRGECAQACRLPYEIIRDGEVLDLAATRYLLSPQDLAAHDLIPELIAAGVASLKIEGRLKTPEYVANVTAHYRRAIDAAVSGRPSPLSRADVQEMEMSFSRGFSHGFFDGNNHKVLVRGDYAKKRGVFLGRVAAVEGARVRVPLAAPLKPGDGVVFDAVDDPAAVEQGGRVYEVMAGRSGSLLGFGRNDIDLGKIRPGQSIWKTDDPELSKRLRKSFEGPPRRLRPLDFAVRAVVGEPLSVQGSLGDGIVAVAVADAPLAPAERLPATVESLRADLDKLGGTHYRLGTFQADIGGGPMVPKSLLNGLRRSLVAELDALSAAVPARTNIPLPSAKSPPPLEPLDGPSRLLALCRTTPQAVAATMAGIGTIYLEYPDIKGYAEALARTREARPDVQIYLATPRIEKPGEGNIFRFLSRLGADGLLVRNAGGLAYCAAEGVAHVADFSLNAANPRSVDLLLGRGASRVTASYDLSVDQLEGLLRGTTAGRVEVVVHQRIPMFHMEHCVFCAFLSPGTDKTNCGRPCDAHDVKLRDRVGQEHPLTADVGCRNTLYQAVPQTAAEFLPRLTRAGARHLRVEFLDESPAQVAKVLELYRGALEGRREGRTLWRDLKASSHYGLTRGALAVIG